MPIKEKFLGVILILVAILPMLSKIESIKNYFSSGILSYLVPGEIIYQIILIVIGILLVISLRSRYKAQRY
ncbi:MAG: hypothetical protein PHH54_00765 [Candidatus Nanoarchaeia archaeon]|nr:hypothetical protein [Candidatus Nanoarchaeia archaeon]MDD5740494.1 hypothetical protein [Candidatus Nanoarchaeia archaeon]